MLEPSEPKMEDPTFRTRVVSKEEITPDQQQDLLSFFKVGYGERWISDDNFWQVMLPNCTELLMVYAEGSLAAALLLDHQRISDIAVNPDMRGQGLGVRLFQEAAKVHPDVWISVGISAEEMLRTVSSEELNFFPVEDQSRIEALFKETNRARDNFQVETSMVSLPLLSKRLAQKGVVKDRFLVFNRVGATHGASYQQILFQNRGYLPGGRQEF